MSWYYAENNERRGPIDVPAFDALIHAGAIKPETLVWSEGMPNWVPCSQSGHQPAFAGMPPIPSGDPTATSTTPAGVAMGMCSESGRVLPRSELVEIDGRLVSAEYKNVVLQRIREGVSTIGSCDPEALAQEVLDRGYQLSATNCFARGWRLMMGNFWLTVGSCFLTMMVSQASAMLPIIGPILVYGPLKGGMQWLMIRLIRGEKASVSDAFEGFNRGFGQLLGVTAVLFGVSIAAFIPAAVVIVGFMASGGDDPSVAGILAGSALGFVGMCVAIYYWVSWTFAMPLIVDKRLDFWPAMKLSRRVVSLHWWQVFGVLFFAWFIMMAAIMAVAIVFAIIIGVTVAGSGRSEPPMAPIIGMVVVILLLVLLLMPVFYSSAMVAYEDLFGKREHR